MNRIEGSDQSLSDISEFGEQPASFEQSLGERMSRSPVVPSSPLHPLNRMARSTALLNFSQTAQMDMVNRVAQRVAWPGAESTRVVSQPTQQSPHEAHHWAMSTLWARVAREATDNPRFVSLPVDYQIPLGDPLEVSGQVTQLDAGRLPGLSRVSTALMLEQLHRESALYPDRSYYIGLTTRLMELPWVQPPALLVRPEAELRYILTDRAGPDQDSGPLEF